MGENGETKHLVQQVFRKLQSPRYSSGQKRPLTFALAILMLSTFQGRGGVKGSFSNIATNCEIGMKI